MSFEYTNSQLILCLVGKFPNNTNGLRITQACIPLTIHTKKRLKYWDMILIQYMRSGHDNKNMFTVSVIWFKIMFGISCM